VEREKERALAKGIVNDPPPEAILLKPEIGFLFKHRSSANIVAGLTITQITVTKIFHTIVPKVRTSDLHGLIPNLRTIPLIHKISTNPKSLFDYPQVPLNQTSNSIPRR